MPNDSLKKYYSYLKSNGADVPPTYESFVNTLSNESNARKYHSYLLKNNFDAPKSYDAFASTLGIIKKKETTVSPSVQKPKPISSGTQPKVTQKPSGTSVSGKPEGLYSAPGNELAVFKKTSDGWYVDNNRSGNFIKLQKGDVEKRVTALEKNAKKLFDADYEKSLTWKAQPQPKVEQQRTKQTQDQKQAQQLFENTFKALDADDPIVVEKNKISELSSDVSTYVDKSEAQTVEDLTNKFKETKYDIFDFEETGWGDMLKVTNRKTGQDIVIDLDGSENEKKILQSFIESNLSFREYNDLVERRNNINKELLSPTLSGLNQVELEKELSDINKKIKEQEIYRKGYALSKGTHAAAAMYGKQKIKDIDQQFNDNVSRLIGNSVVLKEEAAKNLEFEKKLKQDYSNGIINKEQYNEILNDKSYQFQKQQVQDRYNELTENAKSIKEDRDLMEKVVAEARTAKEERGDIGSNILANFAYGFVSPYRMLAQAQAYTKPVYDSKGNRLYDQEVLSKEAFQDILPGIITDEYITSEKRSDFEKAIAGVAESLGAVAAIPIGGGAAKVSTEAVKRTGLEIVKNLSRKALLSPSQLGLFASSYMNFKDQINSDPETAKIDEADKVLLSGAYAYVSSKLESFGMSKWFTRSPAGTKVTSYVMSKVFKDLPKDATQEMIDNRVNSSVKALITKGAISLTAKGNVEGTTEALQELADITLKSAYNEMKGEEIFQNPSFPKIVDRMAESYKLGLIGGTIMSSTSQILSTAKESRTAIQLKQLENIISDPNLKKMFEDDVKVRVLSGEITKEQGENELREINDSASIMNEIPDYVKDKTESFKLISEKRKIEKEIAGKDESLIATQKARIAEIDNQLKTIGENAVKESTKPVEEVAAEGGGVQYQGTQEGQPEVRETERPVGQAAQPSPDLGNRPVEGRSAEEARVTRNVINRPATLSEFGGKTFDTPLQGDTYVDGQQVVFEDRATGRIYELGNIDEVMDSAIPGLQAQEETISITPEGKVSIEGNNWNIQSELPTQGIEYNPAGEVTRVSLKDDAGNTQMFEGQQAVDIAYQIELQKYQTEEQQQFINDLLEQDEEFQSATANIKPAEVAATVQEETATDIVPTEPAAVQEAVVEQPVVDEAAVDEEVERLGKLLEGTDEQIDEQIGKLRISKGNNKVAQSIANAAKSIAKILPDVKFVVHDTDESYRKATGEQNRKQSTAGEYNPKTRTIHINGTKANNRTAAHEVFHAVILEGVKNDAEAQRLTKAMIDAVRKSLVNVDGAGEIISYLNDFASNYKENIQNEEKLAELFAILSDSYATLPMPTQSLIRRFLDRIAKMFGLKPLTDREVIDFMNIVSFAVAEGDEIQARQIPGISKSKIKELNSRFQADFSDAISKLTFVFDKNGDRFKKLEKDGFITRDKSLSDFNGKYVFLHQPDAAFSGMIFKDGEILVEGKGGVFYPIKFHEDGYFWASTDTAAEKMADDLNKVMEQNGGTIYMALTSAPSDKLMSSTTMANAILDFFSSKVFDKNFKLSEAQLKSSLIKAANDVKIKKIKNKKTGKITEKPYGLDLKLSNKLTIDEIQSAIRTALGSENSSFEDRKNFSLELTKLMAGQINKNDVAVNQFGKLFSEGIQNKYFKGITKTGKLKISAANMTQALSEMFTEPMLKEGINRKKGGQVYAILELNGPVKPEPSTKHESYPMAIESVNKDSKVTLHLLNDRQNWNEVFEDFETGEIVSKDRMSNVFPSNTGVSKEGLRLNTSKVAPETKTARKQLVAPNGKPSNLNEKQWNQVRTPEFKKWFGDWENDPENASKVVDENGEPLMTYHGSAGGFDEFKEEYLGGTTDTEISKMGFFFTNNENVAKTFQFISQEPNIDELREIVSSMSYDEMVEFNDAVMKTRHFRKGGEIMNEDDESYEDFLKDVENDSKPSNLYDSFGYMGKVVDFLKSKGIEFNPYTGGEMYKVFLNIRNPFEINADGELLDNSKSISYNESKYDGVIVRNTLDSIPMSERDGGIESDVFITKNPTAIKSATENVGTFSPEEKSIRKQIDNSFEARNQNPKRIEDIISIARDNGFSDAAIKKYLLDKGFNEQEIKDAFKIQPKAPSTAKILGKPAPKKITVNEATALKDQLKLEAKAAREADMDLKRKQRTLVAFINGMKRKGLISINQAAALAQRIVNTNVNNPVMVNRMLDYAERLFKDAEYKNKLSNARSNRKRIKSAIKNKNLQGTVVSVAKEFSSIDPRLIDDIDTYNAYAEVVLNAVGRKALPDTRTAMKFSEVLGYSEIAKAEMKKYLDKEVSDIDKAIEKEVLEKPDTDGMTASDIKNLIESLKGTEDVDVSNAKKQLIVEYIKKFFNEYKPVINQELQDSEISKKSKELMRKLIEIDLAQIDLREAVKVIDAIQNFITNGITDNVEAIVRTYEGQVNAQEIADSNMPVREAKLGGIARLWSEQMMNLPVLADWIFKSPKRAIQVLNKMGFTDFQNGVAKAVKNWTNYVDSYHNTFKKKKANGKNFMDAENIYERGMYAFLKRTVAGDEVAQQKEFERKVGLINKSIDVLKKQGSQKDLKVAEIYEQLMDKFGLNTEGATIDNVESKIDPINKDAVNWWINTWAENYGDLSDVSQNVYNTVLGKDINYTPDKFSSLDVANSKQVEEMIDSMGGGGFAGALNYEYDKKTGVLMPSSKPVSMETGRYVNLNFDMNNSRALKAALVDINTAGATKQIKGFLKSGSWNNIIKNKEDRDLFRSRVDSYILASRNKRTATDEQALAAFERTMRAWASIGATRALGGIFQPIKQVVPVMVNTAINVGRNFSLAVTRDQYSWIDKIGMPISNRGIESMAAFEDADKEFENNVAIGAYTKAMSGIEALNKKWLKLVLSNPDVFAARSSFIAYYKQALRAKGMSADIDFTKPENADQEALNYAQHMVDRQQNVSDAALMGDLFTSNQPLKKIIKNTLFPFMSFVINQKSRMVTDLATFSSKDVSTQEKINAFKSLSALTSEMAVFHTISFGIKYYIVNAIVGAISGEEEDEEEVEKAMKRQFGYTVGTVAKDIFSPVPIATDKAVEYGVDYLLDIIGKSALEDEAKLALKNKNIMLEDEGENPITGDDAKKWIEKYVEDNRVKVQSYEAQGPGGVYRIAFDKFSELYDTYKLASEGSYESEGFAGKPMTKYIDEKGRDDIKEILPYYAAWSALGIPAEFGTIFRKYESKIKRDNGLTEKQKEAEAEVLKTSKKEKLNDLEFALVKKLKGTTTQSGAERVIEELDWIKENGGVNGDKQIKKYIEILETYGEVMYDDLKKIQSIK